MTLTILLYDESTGEIDGLNHVADHDYEPGPGEMEVTDTTYHNESALVGKMVDTSTDPPSIVDDPEWEWKRPQVVNSETHDIIVNQFQEAGSNALQADSSIQSNSDIPQEIKDYTRANIQMKYLIYVSLTGDRIQSVEDDYFPVQ